MLIVQHWFPIISLSMKILLSLAKYVTFSQLSYLVVLKCIQYKFDNLHYMSNSIQPAIAPSNKGGKKKQNPQKNPQILFE
jgi:hypothetical protein